MQNIYCVIMAGGSGTRFWPRSKSSRPKQYLNLFGNESLIQSTIRRFEGMTDKKNILIVSNQSQAKVLESQASGIPMENLIYEPAGKNTLPCIGLAAMIAELKDPDGVMVVSPSDHLIEDEKAFRNSVISAIDLARSRNGIVTVGIKPGYAATGFGYVEVGEELGESRDVRKYTVKKFVEKPDHEKAVSYLEQGGFFWNSGMFIFKIAVFLEAIRKFKPEIYAGLRKIQAAAGSPEFSAIMDRIYRNIENISIDYGIMEHARNLYLVQGDFKWNDLGSWESVYLAADKDLNGNACIGETLTVDSQNCYIYADKGLVSVAGLDDIIVVKEGDSVLVCRRDNAEAVKKVVETLRNQNKYKYL